MIKFKLIADDGFMRGGDLIGELSEEQFFMAVECYILAKEERRKECVDIEHEEQRRQQETRFKIHAIKKFREQSNLGLYESKLVMDFLERFNRVAVGANFVASVKC